MDLLFSKYASPFILLNGVIGTGRFLEFVLTFIEADNEKNFWDVWLHKIFDQSFEEFRKSVSGPGRVSAPEKDMGASVKLSKDILQNFIPEE